jgi:multisubunit Na+/H+ antiporter MnhB subunit
MPRQRQAASRPSRPVPGHRLATRILSIAMILLGVALIVRTALAGGGALATGLVLGVLFVAVGAGRLYLQSRST